MRSRSTQHIRNIRNFVTTIAIVSVTLILVATNALGSHLNAQQQGTDPGHFIYQIRSEQCDQLPHVRVQTGFAMLNEHTSGIVTALHGVVDCRIIKAIPDAASIISNLELTHVDIEHDVALLKPKQGSLPISSIYTYNSTLDVSCESTDSIPVVIFGYGENTKFKNERDGTIGCMRELKNKISSDPSDLYEYQVRNALRARKSPSLDITIFDVKIQVSHGDSGAPIFYPNDDLLLGVVIGGLGTGTGWGIPWQHIQWDSISEPPISQQVETLRKQKIADSLMTYLGILPDSTSIGAPPQVSYALQVKANQPWKGDFTVERLFFPTHIPKACVIVLTRKYEDPEKIKIAEGVFSGNVPNTNKAITMFTPPTKEAQSKFCTSLYASQQNGASLPLYAYLVTLNGKSCSAPILTPEKTYVMDEFTVNPEQTRISQTGFCADRSIWNG